MSIRWPPLLERFQPPLRYIASVTDRPLHRQGREAMAAGFGGLDQIAPSLRTLIGTHHDTFAVPVD